MRSKFHADKLRTIFENAKLIDYGKFSVNDDDIGIRLMKIRQEVEQLIKYHKVEEVVFEDIQMQSNVVNNV